MSGNGDQVLGFSHRCFASAGALAILPTDIQHDATADSKIRVVMGLIVSMDDLIISGQNEPVNGQRPSAGPPPGQFSPCCFLLPSGVGVFSQVGSGGSSDSQTVGIRGSG
jgi:hypothetical protein